MKELNPQAFGAYLDKSDIPPVIVIFGPETFFHDEILEKIEEQVFTNKAEKDFNYEIFYGPESEYIQIISSCTAFPMMSSKKMVVVKQFEKLKIDNQEILLKYIKDPQNSSVLVLDSEQWPKKKFYEEIRSNSICVNCRHLNDAPLFKWVQSKFVEQDIQIPVEALSFLIENTGSDLIRLKIEIEKILNFIKPEKSIDKKKISEITGFSREFDVYTLQKTLGKKDLKKSLKTGLSLLEHGNNLAAILPIIYLFFQKLWIIKYLKERGKNQPAILREVNGLEYQWREAFAGVENYSIETIIHALEEILKSEILLKTSQKSEKSILSLLLFHICSK